MTHHFHFSQFFSYCVTPTTPYRQNSPFLYSKKEQTGIFIDPGGDVDILANVPQNLGCRPLYILLTHGHFDHVGAAQDLKKKFDIPIYGPHKNETALLQALPQQSAGRPGFNTIAPFLPDRFLDEHDSLAFESHPISIKHCPGHTPGHLIYQIKDLLFTGDVLFHGAIGRSDFPYSNTADLLHAIHKNILSLPDTIHFVPGHGSSSTIGAERQFLLRNFFPHLL